MDLVPEPDQNEKLVTSVGIQVKLTKENSLLKVEHQDQLGLRL